MKKNLVAFLILVLGLGSCSGEKNKINESIVDLPLDSLSLEQKSPSVSFFQYENAPEFPDAILELYTPLGNQIFKPGKVPFEFNVKNFSIQQDDETKFRLFNILNGGDPVGFYSPIFQRDLTEGSYRIVAYLVDGDGFALKNFGNYVDRDFQVGDSRPFPYSDEPYLAINLPTTEQVIADGENLIIDFLVLGGDMKLDGLKVSIELANYSYEIDHMAPVYVENLKAGEYLVKIRLLRSNGTELEGPFSSVTRTVFVE